MTPEQLSDRFRRDVDDVKVSDYEGDLLFTDDEIMDYMDEAHRRFIVETRYLHKVLELPVMAGEATTPLPTTFLDVRGTNAYLQTARCAVAEQSLSKFSTPRDDYGTLLTGNPLDTSYQQQPQFFSLDIENNRIHFWPTPAEDDTLLLPAYVEPESILETGCFAIQNTFHIRAILAGMKSIAYAKQDADSYDPNQAQRWEAEFQRLIADVGSERMRRRRKPQQVRYGGL